MKKFYPLAITALGVFLMAGGILYGAMFAGLPGPDDSPAEAARVSMHGNIAFGGLCLGVLAFLAGLLALSLRVFTRKLPPAG